MGFGTPKYGNSNFKPSPKKMPKGEGSVTVRVLPPILECSKTGAWAVAHTQHFGYSVAGAGSDKKIFKPFYCVETVRWENGEKIVVQSCPECELRLEKEAEKEATESSLRKQKRPEAEIKKTLEPLNNWLFSHNRDFKYYLNVKDISGDYYTLAVAGKVKKAIDALIKDYKAKKPSVDLIDATQGLWLTITKSGAGLQTEYKVEPLREVVVMDGQEFEKIKLAPLTDNDCQQAEAKCHDLNDVGIRRLSLDKIKLLVESHGDEETVEAIFKSSERRERSSSAEVSPTPVETPVQKAAPVKAQAVVAPEPPPMVVEEEDEVAKAMAALKNAQEKKAAAKAAPVAPPAPKPAPAPASSIPGLDQDDEDFIKQFRT